MCDNEKCSCHCEDIRYQELSGKPEIENIQEEIFKFWESEKVFEQSVNKENASTNMLLIQAKAKVLNEKAGFSKDDSILKGQKLSDITGKEVSEEKENKIIDMIINDKVPKDLEKYV